MNLDEFINEYFIEMSKNYYSKYDIAEKGFAYQDASYYSLKEVKNEYDKFLKNKEEWLKEYQW